MFGSYLGDCTFDFLHRGYTVYLIINQTYYKKYKKINESIYNNPLKEMRSWIGSNR